MKKGSKNVVAIDKATRNIEQLTELFKRKRLTKEEYIREVNQSLASMTDERNYIEYLVNIGQY